MSRGKTGGTMNKEAAFRKYRDLTAGLVFALFAIVYLWGSSFIPKSTIMRLGAEFMPRIYGTVMLLLALIQVATSLLVLRIGSLGTADEGSMDTRNVLLTLLLILAYIGSMELVGFIIASILYFFFQAILLAPSYARKRYAVYLITAVVLAFFAFYIFRSVLYLALPRGALFG